MWTFWGQVIHSLKGSEKVHRRSDIRGFNGQSASLRPLRPHSPLSPAELLSRPDSPMPFRLPGSLLCLAPCASPKLAVTGEVKSRLGKGLQVRAPICTADVCFPHRSSFTRWPTKCQAWATCQLSVSGEQDEKYRPLGTQINAQQITRQ